MITINKTIKRKNDEEYCGYYEREIYGGNVSPVDGIILYYFLIHTINI